MNLVLDNALQMVRTIRNDYQRRALAIVLFVVMGIIAIVGCLIELIIKCVVAVWDAIVEYVHDIKYPIKDFARVYLDLW
tara:strand:+ start:10 stop:246 length:237 start_codon:yes stop_codon:yes gene_type:complete